MDNLVNELKYRNQTDGSHSPATPVSCMGFLLAAWVDVDFYNLYISIYKYLPPGNLCVENGQPFVPNRARDEYCQFKIELSWVGVGIF